MTDTLEKPMRFFSRYGRAPRAEAAFVALESGFLRLEYDEFKGEPALLSKVSLVAAASLYSKAIGRQLLLEWSGDGQVAVATLIAKNAVSGTQWQKGHVAWGSTYDDAPSGPPRAVALEAWVDECVEKMSHPQGAELQELTEVFDLQASLAAIKGDKGSARDRLWMKCTPRTENEAELVLGLLEKDPSLEFICTDPLKRAEAGVALILTRLTSLIERRIREKDDSDTLQEIALVHAGAASAEVAGAWLAICSAGLDKRGLEALEDSRLGALFRALAKAPQPSAARQALFAKVDRLVAKLPESERAAAKESETYEALQRSGR